MRKIYPLLPYLLLALLMALGPRARAQVWTMFTSLGSTLSVSVHTGLPKSWVDEQLGRLQDSRMGVTPKAVKLGAGFSFSYPALVVLPTLRSAALLRLQSLRW